MEVLRAAIEKIDAGIAVSESARNVVVQHLGRDAVVIPNGIRFDDFARRPRPIRQAESPPTIRAKPRLVFIGRLDEPRKGLDVLLAAVPLIKQARPNLEVIVAGQGSRPLPPGAAISGRSVRRPRSRCWVPPTFSSRRS